MAGTLRTESISFMPSLWLVAKNECYERQLLMKANFLNEAILVRNEERSAHREQL
jgi:hypothetical protein